MPNWCDNRLIVEGPPEELERFDRAFKGPDGYYSFSNLYPESIDARLSSLYNSLFDIMDNRKRLEEFLRAVMGMWRRGEIPLDKFLEVALDPSPYTDQMNPIWYRWRLDRWGVKWDIDEVSVSTGVNSISYEFQTAWAPPADWLRKVIGDWPALRFTLEYFEPGVFFGGRVEPDGEDHRIEGSELYDFAASVFGYDFDPDDAQ